MVYVHLNDNYYTVCAFDQDVSAYVDMYVRTCTWICTYVFVCMG